MTRKNLRRIIKPVGYLVVGVAILGIIATIVLVIFTIFSDKDLSVYWGLLKDSFSILGPIGTLLAVIVALNKEELNRVLYAPEFVFSPTTITPKAVLSPNDPKTIQKYAQYIKVENIGVGDAQGCHIDLVSLKYDKNRHSKYKVISPVEQQSVFCGLSDSIITKTQPYEFLLFEVDNPGAESNPGNQGVQPAAIRFNGFTLALKHSSMGQYQLQYRLSTKDGISHTFIVEVDWAGEWSDDQEDMVEKFVTKVK